MVVERASNKALDRRCLSFHSKATDIVGINRAIASGISPSEQVGTTRDAITIDVVWVLSRNDFLGRNLCDESNAEEGNWIALSNNVYRRRIERFGIFARRVKAIRFGASGIVLAVVVHANHAINGTFVTLERRVVLLFGK